MSFQSILDLIPNEKKINPMLLTDLNLDKVINEIQYYWFQDIKSYFNYFPITEKCEQYRRNVYADVKKANVLQTLNNYVNRMREYKEACSKREQVEIELQAATWHLKAAYAYFMAYDKMREELAQAELESEGFLSLLEYLHAHENNAEIVKMKTAVYELNQMLCNFRLVLSFENNIISLTEGELDGTYDRFLDEAFPAHTDHLKSPFTGSVHLSSLEGELIGLFKKKNPQFFKDLLQFYKKYPTFEDGILMKFFDEIGFYMAFNRFEEKLINEGCDFSQPHRDSAKELSAVGLYDLALACTNMKIGKEVVANDFIYHSGEEFMVVTGPNQGGKTTFARSIGQLIFFAKMGLDVPATYANIHYFTNILTHFSVEESIATGRGKLKEELDRLAPMMCAVYENAFVIINELFTTAANYDACIMGKKVISHFIEQKCRGVYVTHLKELSEDNEHVVSLKALVEEHTEHNRIKAVRKYKIIRSKADDLGYADDLVDKHRLAYDQIKSRLSKGGSYESQTIIS